MVYIIDNLLYYGKVFGPVHHSPLSSISKERATMSLPNPSLFGLAVQLAQEIKAAMPSPPRLSDCASVYKWALPTIGFGVSVVVRHHELKIFVPVEGPVEFRTWDPENGTNPEPSLSPGENVILKARNFIDGVIHPNSPQWA